MDGNSYRLSEIGEILKQLEQERDYRYGLSRKYRRGIKLINIADAALVAVTMGLGVVGVSLLSTIVGVPIVLVVEGIALGTGLLNIASKYANTKLTRKVEKHENIKILAETKLSDISIYMSKALDDNIISDSEYNVIADEFVKFREMITDPEKKDLKVQEFLELKKNIKNNFTAERQGEQDTFTELTKHFKPVTDAHKEQTQNIISELAPIKNVFNSQFIPVENTIAPDVDAEDDYIGNIAVKYLRKFATKDADMTYGLQDRNSEFYIGDQRIGVIGNNIAVGDKEYIGTSGLWELIVMKKPTIYTNEDYENYAEILINTNALRKDASRPKASKSWKWKNILSTIWDERDRFEGSGTIIIPSDPNALLDRFDLLMASKVAVIKNRGFKRQYVYGGAGMFSTIAEFLAPTAKQIVKSAGEEIGKVGKKVAIDGMQRLAAKFMRPSKADVASKAQSILSKYIPQNNINAMIDGSGVETITIQDLVRKMNGSGLKMI
ncbi:hypothetical protein GQR58_018801 [Nymphon striatum]|nr:hypothetical protein GQR58_019519 [Nymphon striatum]KAG1666597.1 hypothetical protein GQR58_018801 [Nymphon striatum]